MGRAALRGGRPGRGGPRRGAADRRGGPDRARARRRRPPLRPGGGPVRRPRDGDRLLPPEPAPRSPRPALRRLQGQGAPPRGPPRGARRRGAARARRLGRGGLPGRVAPVAPRLRSRRRPRRGRRARALARPDADPPGGRDRGDLVPAPPSRAPRRPFDGGARDDPRPPGEGAPREGRRDVDGPVVRRARLVPGHDDAPGTVGRRRAVAPRVVLPRRGREGGPRVLHGALPGHLEGRADRRPGRPAGEHLRGDRELLGEGSLRAAQGEPGPRGVVLPAGAPRRPPRPRLAPADDAARPLLPRARRPRGGPPPPGAVVPRSARRDRRDGGVPVPVARERDGLRRADRLRVGDARGLRPRGLRPRGARTHLEGRRLPSRRSSTPSAGS